MTIVEVTGFPKAFFSKEPAKDFSLGSLLFRARASMTAREHTRARRYGQVVHEFAHMLLSRVKPIPFRLPTIHDSPVEAAQLARAMLGLSPDTPIPNLIRAIERGGVLVLALPVKLQGIDAFSVWSNDRPVIVISKPEVGDRMRYSIAHELGHAVMHQSISDDLEHIEREANQFAGEFLLPSVAMREELVQPVTLLGIAGLKPRWRVSIQMLIMRASELDVITQRQKRYLFQQVSGKGWKTREPENLDVPIEKPRSLMQLVEMIYGLPVPYERVAAEASLPVQLVREILSAYAPGQASAPDNVVAFPFEQQKERLKRA